MKLNLGNL